MATEQKIVRDFLESIKASSTGTEAYDTTAEVVRIEGNTAWVHIPGGVDETPVAMTINAIPGDTVRVRVAGGTAWLTGSDSAPPTDDRMANEANLTANTAMLKANTATESAEEAAAAAEQAIESAGVAAGAAAQAQADAATANTAAVNALTQLSTVEDVVGTLNWIAEHGEYSATEDTEVVPGKTYYIRTGEEGNYSYAVVENPADNPEEAGYYELTDIDESVTNYIKTHLALTDDGLYILLDESDGYRLKLTNTGAYIIDASGQEVAAYSSVTSVGSATGAHVEISGDRMSFKVGDTEVAYIAIDPDTQESIFYMTKAIVVQDLYFGKWQWKARENDNLTLKWIGEEE